MFTPIRVSECCRADEYPSHPRDSVGRGTLRLRLRLGLGLELGLGCAFPGADAWMELLAAEKRSNRFTSMCTALSPIVGAGVGNT